MSLIWTGPTAKVGHWAVYCDGCQRYIGTLTREECGELARAGVTPYCFECDSVGADLVPRVLASCDDVGKVSQCVVAIGDKHFFVDYDAPAPAKYFTPISGVMFLALLGQVA